MTCLLLFQGESKRSASRPGRSSRRARLKNTGYKQELETSCSPPSVAQSRSLRGLVPAPIFRERCCCGCCSLGTSQGCSPWAAPSSCTSVPSAWHSPFLPLDATAQRVAESARHGAGDRAPGDIHTDDFPDSSFDWDQRFRPQITKWKLPLWTDDLFLAPGKLSFSSEVVLGLHVRFSGIQLTVCCLISLCFISHFPFLPSD